MDCKLFQLIVVFLFHLVVVTPRNLDSDDVMVLLNRELRSVDSCPEGQTSAVIDGKYTCEKPWSCPAFQDANITVCLVSCTNDSECLRSKKCCDQGCAKSCFLPVKPGICPISQGADQPGCPINCKNDFTCAGNDKCCDVGCSKICMPPVCIYHDGTEYQFGETFSAWHGCSQCVCNDGIIICDDSLCVEAGCVVDGKEIMSGNSVQMSDGCNNCTCNNGKLNCTGLSCIKQGSCPAFLDAEQGDCLKSCDDDSMCAGNNKCCDQGCSRACMPPVCKYFDGHEYMFGETFAAWKGCSVCLCENGQITCDDTNCVDAACMINGYEVLSGSMFLASDGCNNCTCENGKFDCTETQCRCPDGSFPVSCSTNPCEVFSCKAYPNAVCFPNYCGGCHAEYFTINGSRLSHNCECQDKTEPRIDCHEDETCARICHQPIPESSDSSSSDDLTSEYQLSVSKLDTHLICVMNVCGECKPEFYNKEGERVECDED